LKLFKKNLIQNKSFQGEAYVFAEVILWSLFPIFSILAFTSLSPLYTASISTLIAAAFFASILTIRKQWQEIKNRSAWKDILIATTLIGVIFYSLIFIGLERTTAGNASIVFLMEVFFSMFILGLWKKEKLEIKHKLGAILMVIGALFIFFPGKLQVNEGDLIILVATAVPPIGNYFAQSARKKVGSTMIMFIRSLIAGVCILLLAIIFSGELNGRWAVLPTLQDISNSAFFLLVNGIFLMGLSKIFFLEAIHRIPISKAISINSVNPAFTLLFAYFILGEIPTIWQIMGFLPIFIGIMLLTEYKISWEERLVPPTDPPPS
jgi:drug/metabolite transporter (DMT)-like permease